GLYGARGSGKSLAAIAVGAAARPVAARKPDRPRARLEAGLDAVVERVVARPRLCANERSVVLDAQPERQEHPPRLDVQRLAPVIEQSVGLAVDRGAGRHLLVEV